MATPRRSGGLLRVAAALLAAVALAALPALPAQAHDSLTSTTPAAGATVGTAPRAITLGFDEPVLDYADTTVLIVTGPDGAKRHFETACARVDGRTVSAPVALGGSGRYTVTWRVVSADGHPVADSFAFTLRRAAGTTPAPGSVSGPRCGGGTATGAGASAPASSVSPLVWVLIGVGGGLVLVLLVVVIVVAVLLSRRSAKAGADAERGAP
jgi:copper resistance protein C